MSTFCGEPLFRILRAYTVTNASRLLCWALQQPAVTIIMSTQTLTYFKACCWTFFSHFKLKQKPMTKKATIMPLYAKLLDYLSWNSVIWCILRKDHRIRLSLLREQLVCSSEQLVLVDTKKRFRPCTRTHRRPSYCWSALSARYAMVAVIRRSVVRPMIILEN